MNQQAICAALIISSAGVQADHEDAELTIEASGFQHSGGQAVAKLFAPGDNVMGPGRWQVSGPIVDGVAVLRFHELPAGRYAAVLFHDENGNETLDHGLLGPAEPLTFSGGFSLSLFSGLPNFEKLQFEIHQPAQRLTLRLP